MAAQYLTSDLLGDVPHGFFTRQGGASEGIFASLNCGYGSNEQAEIIAINRRLVADALGLATDRLAGVHQVHSPQVVTVTAANAGDRPRADAMVTAEAGLGLGVLTADCMPVLFADARAGVIGAAHAGWKGARDGVIGATVDAMCALGADRGRIAAAIGPTISQRAYEVGPEFLEGFVDEDAANARFFANGKGDRYQFDLPSYGLTALRAAGVDDVHWTGHCTYSDEERFFSYRRSVHRGQDSYGRLISVIRLP